MKLIDLRIADLINLSPAVSQLTNHAAELQDTAVSLGNNVRKLLGQEAEDRLLRSQANIAPHVLRAELLAPTVTQMAGQERQQIIQVANAQALTLAGTLAVTAGEDPGCFYGDCLSSGEMARKPVIAECICCQAPDEISLAP